MRDGELPPYNRRTWEPLWAVCEELGMPLVTHVGGGTNARYSGLESVALLQLESAMFSRRAVWWLIFAGVFERHPGLKLVITETPGNWFPPTATELDTLHAFYDVEARRAVEQGAARASAAAAERVHGEQRVLRRELRVAVRGGAGGAARTRVAVALGLRLSPPRGHVRVPRRTRGSVGDPARVAEHFLRRPRSGDRADDRRQCDRGLQPRCGRAARRSRARSTPRRSTSWPRPSTRCPKARSVTAFRSGAGGWS